MAWGNPEQMALEEKFCQEFNAQNPDIYVHFFRVPGSSYTNKAIVMFASRTAPDVVRIDHYDFTSLVKKNYFYDLTPIIAEDKTFRFDDYFKLAMDEARYEGGFYGMNVMFGAELVYYNKKMIREAGLEDPYVLYKRGEWTWDKYREYAIAMTKTRKDGRPLQFGCSIPSWPMNVPVLKAYGGKILTDDGQHSLVGEGGCAKGYQYLADLRWKYHCAPTPAQAANSAFTFESGQVGMVPDWMGMGPRYRSAIKTFEWDVCPIPKGPVGNGTSIVKGNQLIVYKETKHPKEAWRFIRFLTGREVEMKLYVQNRRNFPSRKDVAYSKEFLETKLPPRQPQAYLDAVENAEPLPITDRWKEWTTEIRNAEDDIYSGRVKDVEARLKKAQTAIDKILVDEEGF